MDTIEDARLLACPFCGGKAALRIMAYGDWDWEDMPEHPDEEIEDDDEFEEQYMPICTKCDASFFYDGPTFYTKEQAIEAWNKRA